MVEDGVLEGGHSEVKSKMKGNYVDQQSVMLLKVVSLLKAILLVCLYSACSVVCVVCNPEQVNGVFRPFLTVFILSCDMNE